MFALFALWTMSFSLVFGFVMGAGGGVEEAA